MMKMITKCPACKGDLHIASLACENCGMELRKQYEFSKFDTLSDEQYRFLISFLRNKGSMKDLQNELAISYPTAKKRLEDLLLALDLAEMNKELDDKMEDVDMGKWTIDENSVKASEIIKRKLRDCGGRTVVYTARNLPCEIRFDNDGVSMWSDKLPIKPPYGFDVFDSVVECLVKNGGKARKGNGRNYKLGHSDCDDTTVVGYIGKHYSGKQDGDSVFDPVFVLAAVLEWAEIAHNGRGEIALTASYKFKMKLK